ncbi:hypothetical protein SDC9_137695 [bioreactor metagenome]|uniref:Uncharacterized protein n=1 Tax=bioreactor metagenome TaxID=1076179 RepID=A0A645DM99_9ZZZZ
MSAVSARQRTVRIFESQTQCIGDGFHDAVAAEGRARYGIDFDCLGGDDFFDDGGPSAVEKLVIVLF